MPGFILGKKEQQSQQFDQHGTRIPVTFIRTTPCYVVHITWPTVDKTLYASVKLGFGQAKNIKRSVKGELAKAGIKAPLRFLKEFRLEKFLKKIQFIEENKRRGLKIDEAKLFVGDELRPEILFKKDDLVDVSGVSKGKGFAGVVKRHRFAGGPRTHGQSDRERAPGAIGQTTTPGRVFKGKRMAGRLGGVRVTVKKLSIVEVRSDGLLIKGLVPGAKDGLLEVRKVN